MFKDGKFSEVGKERVVRDDENGKSGWVIKKTFLDKIWSLDFIL